MNNKKNIVAQKFEDFLNKIYSIKFTRYFAFDTMNLI